MLLVCLINAMQDTGISSGHVQSWFIPAPVQGDVQCPFAGAPTVDGWAVPFDCSTHPGPGCGDHAQRKLCAHHCRHPLAGSATDGHVQPSCSFGFLEFNFTFSLIIVKLNFDGRQHNFSTISNESIWHFNNVTCNFHWANVSFVGAFRVARQQENCFMWLTLGKL